MVRSRQYQELQINECPRIIRSIVAGQSSTTANDRRLLVAKRNTVTANTAATRTTKHHSIRPTRQPNCVSTGCRLTSLSWCFAPIC